MDDGCSSHQPTLFALGFSMNDQPGEKNIVTYEFENYVNVSSTSNDNDQWTDLNVCNLNMNNVTLMCFPLLINS